jgi:hypothetical protein
MVGKLFYFSLEKVCPCCNFAMQETPTSISSPREEGGNINKTRVKSTQYETVKLKLIWRRQKEKP